MAINNNLQADSSSRPLILYHAGCPDGFGAAWVARKAFPKAEFIPVSHNPADLPDVTAREVYFLDIAFPYSITISMMQRAHKITILDHHATNVRELLNVSQHFYFDMHRSGAMMTWDYFFPNQTPPWLITYVQDRDLWQWLQPDAREVLSALDSYERTFEIWDQLEKTPLNSMIEQGDSIVRFREREIARLASRMVLRKVRDYLVPTVNSPCYIDDLGSQLAQGHPFAVVWAFDGKKYQYSLRSTHEGIDVTTIAESYGGGGHAQAAAFRVDAPIF